MNNNLAEKHGSFKSYIFLIIMIMIGLMAGIILLFNRINMENQQNRIENIVNYETVMRYNSFEKDSKETIYTKLKESGVTALAIYDTTLKKLAERGEIIIINDADSYLQFLDNNSTDVAGKTYILPAAGKMPYFEETRLALVQRLGQDKVVLRQTNHGLVIELNQPREALLDMNLAISRLQAEEIIAHGFNVIIRPSNFKNEKREDVDFVFNRLQGLNRITGVVFVGKEVLGYPNDVDYTVKRFQALNIPIIGIESTSQLQYEPQLGFNEMAKLEKYEVGRLYTISKDYLKKLEPAKVAQMFYISDIERNVRFNLLTIYEEGKNNKTALMTSLEYIDTLKQKQIARGYELGKGSIYPDYQPNFILVNIVILGIVGLIVLTLNWYIKLSIKQQFIIYIVLALGAILANILVKSDLIKVILALSTAILAPVNAIICCMICWQHLPLKTEKSFVKIVFNGIVFCIGAALIASIGGIFISTLLGSTDFFMEFSIFRGVKLTFILPVVLTAIAYLMRFPLWRGRKLNTFLEIKQFIKELLDTNVKISSVLVIILFLIVAIIFVGRSGHTDGVPVPQFEVAMRHFLENLLFARPREKEFLIGYPALIFAVYALYRRWSYSWHFIFTLGAVIGLGSMVETFAHVRTPVIMSLIRGYNGVLFGVGVGLICLFAFKLLQMLYSKFVTKGECRHE